jgi:hypothetical protein
MKSTLMALAAATLLHATPAAAQAVAPAPRASLGFWGPADSFWRETAELAPCSRTGAVRSPLSAVAPRLRLAGQARHAELLGEILGPAPLAPLVVAKARACVAAPGVSETVPVLLADGAGGFKRFQSAFAACMAGQGAAQYVGSMTLWIDRSCNW